MEMVVISLPVLMTRDSACFLPLHISTVSEIDVTTSWLSEQFIIC